jgi:hypothetical protein
LRKDSSNDVVVYSEVSKSNYILKGLNYSTKYYWQTSVSDGINPPVLSAIRALLRSLFQMRDSYSLRKIICHLFRGCKLQLTNSSINSWRPRKIIKLKKSHLLEQVARKIIFIP